MKHTLVNIIISFVILASTTGFGFLESSTIIRGRINHQIEVDSVKNDFYALQFSNHQSLTKKDSEKPISDQITKSIIQSVANLVKNITQIMVHLLVVVCKVILMVILNLFIG
jgi:hypothetical protein